MAMTILGLALAIVACLLAPRPATAQSPALPPLLLVGGIIPEAGEPMAITEDPQTHEQKIHMLGAQIGDVRLMKILKDRVVLTSGDAAIEVRRAGPAPRPSRTIPSRPPPGRSRRPEMTWPGSCPPSPAGRRTRSVTPLDGACLQ
jgi:hypothetical protein